MTDQDKEPVKTDTSETLRETLEHAIEEHTSDSTDAVKIETTPEPTAKKEEVKPIASERLRDEKGKFVKAEAPATIPVAKIEPEGGVTEPVLVPEPILELITPPTSWKKEHHESFVASPRAMQEYILQRESEFASGVSTYKAEYERIRPLDDAMEPFREDLRANNIDEREWISNLGNAHKMLALGTPEQKLSMFMKLATDYQIPVQEMFNQGEDGKLYFNPQVQQYQQPQPDIDAIVESKLAEYSSRQEIDSFGLAKDADGNTLHPHYDVVRETMAQLLESGLADDLESAYDTALRHPRHADIAASISKQETDTVEAAKLKKIKDETERAKRNTVSTKSSTPASPATQIAKGLRATIEAAVEEHTSTDRI